VPATWDTQLFSVELPGIDKTVGYAGFTGCQQGGITKYRESCDTALNILRTSITNYSVLMLYKECFGPIPENRIVWEVSNRTKYHYKPSDGYFSEWLIENGYCYEAVSLLTDQVSFKNRLKQDL